MSTRQSISIIPILRILAFAGFAFSITLSGFANPNSALSLANETPSRPLPWPKGAKGVEIQEVTLSEDGAEAKLLSITCSAFSALMDPFGTWEIAVDESGKFPTFLKRIEDDNPFEMGFAVFDKRVFLKSLEDEEWNRYIAYLKKTTAPDSELKQDSNIDGKGRVFIFGKPYREIIYTKKSPSGDDIKHRELFAMFPNNLVVISFQGPPQTMDSRKRFQELMMARFSLQE